MVYTWYIPTLYLVGVPDEDPGPACQRLARGRARGRHIRLSRVIGPGRYKVLRTWKHSVKKSHTPWDPQFWSREPLGARSDLIWGWRSNKRQVKASFNCPAEVRIRLTAGRPTFNRSTLGQNTLWFKTVLSSWKYFNSWTSMREEWQHESCFSKEHCLIWICNSKFQLNFISFIWPAFGILTTWHKRVQTCLYHVCTVYVQCYSTAADRHGIYNYWKT